LDHIISVLGRGQFLEICLGRRSGKEGEGGGGRGSGTEREEGRGSQSRLFCHGYLSSQGLAVKAYGFEVRAPTGQRSGETISMQTQEKWTAHTESTDLTRTKISYRKPLRCQTDNSNIIILTNDVS